jgi:threonine/homoserine/homoserine lactone efflux protein
MVATAPGWPVLSTKETLVPEAKTLVAFAAAAYVFALFPGPAVLYVVTRSIEQGRVAGVVSVAGIASGNLVHVVAAILGLSALLMSSATAFTVVKYAGAAYLIYLGIRVFLSKEDLATSTEQEATMTLRGFYVKGLIMNLLNPKVAVSFKRSCRSLQASRWATQPFDFWFWG